MARILVVDDEPQICGLLRTLLTRKGHEVIIARTGAKAIESFKEDRPRLTILDLNLPDMGGIDVLRHIHAIDAHAGVIILTGAGMESLESTATQLGVSAFLQKGFSLHALGEALTRALSHQNEKTPS